MSENRNMIEKERAGAVTERKIRSLQPRVDVYENRDEILLLVEMPGVTRDDLKVDLDNGRLVLTGKRPASENRNLLYAEFGTVDYQRTFSVPQTIDGNKVQAELKDGILHLHLPKSEAFKPRTIEIRAA
jgi:HSP20 family molecular chaperone IbpA